MVSGTENERRKKIDCASAKWNRLVVSCFTSTLHVQLQLKKSAKGFAVRPFTAKSRPKLIPTIIFGAVSGNFPAAHVTEAAAIEGKPRLSSP